MEKQEELSNILQQLTTLSQELGDNTYTLEHNMKWLEHGSLETYEFFYEVEHRFQIDMDFDHFSRKFWKISEERFALFIWDAQQRKDRKAMYSTIDSEIEDTNESLLPEISCLVLLILLLLCICTNNVIFFILMFIWLICHFSFLRYVNK